MKLSQQEHLDVHAQAKILVTVAVVANLLLALVLSLIMLFKPTEAKSESGTTLGERNIGLATPYSPHSEIADLNLPSPEDW